MMWDAFRSVVDSCDHTEAELAFSAGCALATALMFVELNQTCNGSNHISLVGKIQL